jgi:ankyrin repeat protein
LEQTNPPVPELPNELWNHIINFIDNPKDLKQVAQINTIFNAIVKNNHKYRLNSLPCIRSAIMLYITNPLPFNNLLIKTDPNFNHFDAEAFFYSCESKNETLALWLLSRKNFDPRVDENKAIRLAAQHGLDNAVKKLLRNRKINPATEENEAIRKSAENGHVLVVDLLLKRRRRIDPTDLNNRAIRSAAEKGHTEVVKRLLKDKRIKPADLTLKTFLVRAATRNWPHTTDAVVQILLDDGRLDPADKNELLRWAAENGLTELVKRLLKDPQVNPAGHNNRVIGWAAQNGHDEIVALLLEDTRVNPVDPKNNALLLATEKGHTKVIQMLEKDFRVQQQLLSTAN